MKLWKKSITALLLCLTLLAGLTTGAAAMAPVGSVANDATHLRTSYHDSNYLDLTISGNTLTVSGRLLAEDLQQIQVEVGSASQTVNTGEGQLFSVQLPLTHSGSVPVEVYTRQSGSTRWEGLTWHSIYIQKHSDGYALMESQVLSNNQAFAASAIDPQDAFRIQVPDTVAAKSDEIVGNETDDYTKVFLLYQWVAENIYYDYDAYYNPDLRTINTATVLDQRRGVCAGYAALLRDLILAQGIPAIYCSNLSLNNSSYALTASGGEGHAHTEVYVDGRWIVMDATWDSNNEYRRGSYLTEAPNGFYYFDITPEAFALDHKTTSRDQKDYVVADDGFGYSTDGKTILSYDGPGGDVVIYGGNAEAHPPFSVSNENRLLFGGCPRHRRAHEAEHAARRLKHRQRIVISRRDDRSPKFRKFRRPPQKVEVEPLGGDGRHRRVEDVARENEHVHRLRGHEAEKPVEKPTVVFRAVRVGKRTTEMPVRSVENAHAENR